MRLSVCMIVRDEASRLVAALDSVRGVADEIVVVDTGSTDGTPDLAASRGARVESFTWIDDFAAARNRSFELARGDWILMLDADQRLENPNALDGDLEGEAYRIKIVDSGVESWRVSLFRSSLRMVGRIHEYFDPRPTPRDLDLRLRHIGYADGPSEAKHRRNLPLLDAELLERPARLDIRIERARTLAALGNPAAEGELKEALSWIDPDRPPASPTVAMLIETFLMRPDGPSWLSSYAVRWFPASPPLRWLLARRAAQADDFEAAQDHLVRLVGMAEKGDYDRAVGFDARLLGAQPKFQLAGVLVKLGRLDEAARLFESMTSDAEVGAAAATNLAVIQSLS